MEISTDAYDWIALLEVVPDFDSLASASSRKDSMLLNKELVNQLMNGHYFIGIIEKMLEKRGISTDALRSMKFMNKVRNPAARLYNWNMVQEALKLVNIDLGSGLQEITLSEKPESLRKLIQKLYQKDTEWKLPSNVVHSNVFESETRKSLEISRLNQDQSEEEEAYDEEQENHEEEFLNEKEAEMNKEESNPLSDSEKRASYLFPKLIEKSDSDEFEEEDKLDPGFWKENSQKSSRDPEKSEVDFRLSEAFASEIKRGSFSNSTTFQIQKEQSSFSL